jgi:hypothetical protein
LEVGQGLSLLGQQGGEGALEQALRSGLGDLLQGEQVGVQGRTGVAEGAAGNKFAPLGRRVTDILEVLGS